MIYEHDIWQWQEPGTAWKGAGIYHVTLVVPSREPLLGKLVIPENDPKQARVERTELGNALVEKLLKHPTYYPEIKIVQYCLMPDHLHFILYVTRPMEKTFNIVVRSLWQAAKKLGRAYTLSFNPESDSGLTDGEIDGETNGETNRETNRETNGETNGETDGGTNDVPFPIFTERPFVRPLSRKGQLQTMIRYVQMNPQRLATKRIYPELFRVQEGIEIAGRTYRGVGNVALLQAAKYAPVHVRRTMIDEAMHGDNTRLRNYINGCVLAARQGVVMVSPFISDKEKEVMVVLLAEELPIIYIADNGFGDYYKPSDGLFDAVAAGRVLILSPWEYDPSKRHVTRAECVAMNRMAEEICETSQHVSP